MSIVDRAKAILMSPTAEWAKIASEKDQPMQVFTRYVVPLAAIGPVASLIGGQIFGYGAFGFSYRPSLMTGLASAVTSYVLALAMIWVVAWVANFLSPKFAGKDDFPAAFRLVAYAMTASMLAGIFGLIPALSILGILGLYGIYLFYKGAVPLMRVAADKATTYTVVTVLVAVVASLVAGAIAAAITSPMMIDEADAMDEMMIDLGPQGRMEFGEDGAVATITGPDGEKMTITVDDSDR